MARLRFNAVEATLAEPLDDVDTTITFASKLVALDGDVPSIAAPDYLVVRVDDEIMHVTAYTSGATTATVSRGEEGTTAAAHDDGSPVRHVPTADDFGPVLHVAVWDDDLQSYPPRPTGALVVRYIGPIEPDDWEPVDEWRSGYGTFNPAPLDPDEVSGLVQWLKADDLTLDNNDQVSTWTAAVGNNATQATSSNQPIFKTNRIGTMPALEFDNSNDFMSFSGLGAALTQYTLIAVARPDTGGPGNILSQDAGGFSDDLLWGVDPEEDTTTDNKWAAVLQRSSASDRVIVESTLDADTTDASVVAVRYDGTDLALYVNDGFMPVDTKLGVGSCNIADRTWNIGRTPPAQAARYWDGDIAEICIYSVAISDLDLAAVVRGLREKYDLDD